MKIISSILTKLYSALFNFTIGHEFYWLTATLLSFHTKVYNKKCKAEYSILCLERSVFNDDIKALANFGKNLCYIGIPRNQFDLIIAFFNKNDPDWKNISDENYHITDFCKTGRVKYYSFLKKLIPAMQKKHNFSAIISGSFTYICQQELARVCKELNIPFIILLKEALGVMDKLEEFAKDYLNNHKFIGDKMMFYNEYMKNTMIKLDIPGLTPEKTSTVGIPRLDYYYQISPKYEKQIVFFSFDPEESFFYYQNDKELAEKINIKGAEFHKIVMQFAQRHSDYNVIIKTKVPARYKNYVNSIYKMEFNREFSNLIITNKGNPFNMIKTSRAILGMNSTTLIEALIAKKVIITPYLGDICKNLSWDFFTEFPKLVNYAESINDLEKFVFNYQDYIYPDNDYKHNFMYKMIHEPDGKASIRTENAILQCIENNEYQFNKYNKEVVQETVTVREKI